MKVENIQTIALVGAGFIAPGIATIFILKNFEVIMVDIKPEVLPVALANIRNNLTQLANNNIISASEIEPLLRKVTATTDMKAAVLKSQLVIEAVNENLGLKQKIFQQLDDICPTETILCTNTSVMSISEIASKAVHRERIIGTHFWNPPFLIPLVEVVKGNDSSDESIEVVYEILKKAGKHPIKLMKDVPGFIANRLQHALWREAISIVENGIADAATVDEAIKNGFAIRLGVLGPMENADMIGLDLTFSIHDYILKYLDASPQPSELLKEKIQKGELGFKTGKGFFDWTPEEAQRSRERLTQYLLNWTKNQPKEAK